MLNGMACEEGHPKKPVEVNNHSISVLRSRDFDGGLIGVLHGSPLSTWPMKTQCDHILPVPQLHPLY